MSASLIFDLAPLGSIIRYFDGAPRPPERHRKKLAAWETRNNSGRLIAKRPGGVVGKLTVPDSFTLHEGDFGGHGVVLVRIHRTFSIDSELKFSVVERPAIGSVLVLDRPDGELMHLAENRAEANTWLQYHGYPRAVLLPVTADAVAADFVEGRAA
ncbi:MAG: hypothetical protein WBA88_24430 [Pseudaminobacter sp.]